MIPDGTTTFTCQYSATNNTPTDPLHKPLIWNPTQIQTGSTLLLQLRFRHIFRHHNCRKNSSASSRYLLFMRQLSNASTVISIESCSLVTVSKSIRPAISDLTWITVPNFIWLGFYWLYSTPGAHIYFWFNPHNLSHILVKLQDVPYRLECLQII